MPKTLPILFVCVPLRGQFTSFSKSELIKYTPANPYERFADGRPKVPDAMLKRLHRASSEEVWGGLLRGGYRNQSVGDWKLTQPGEVLVVDLFGKLDLSTFVGDNLTCAIYLTTGNGFIVNGAIRDLEGIHRIDAPKASASFRRTW